MLRVLWTLCAALALAVSLGLGSAAAQSGSEDGAPSICAQRRLQPVFDHASADDPPGALRPEAPARAQMRRGQDGAQRREAPRAPPRGRQHSRTQIWDELGRLRSRCYGAYPGGGATRCYTADYDEVGNPTVLGDPERSCTIGYDSLDRVASVTCNDGHTETYAYNALGALSTHAGVAVDHQRPRLSGGGSASAGLPATHGGQPVTVDAVGKVTALQGTTLEWNRLGRLTKTIQGGVTTEYGHDAHFRRVVQKRTGSPLELYLYEGANIAAVASGDGVAGVQRRYLFDGVDHPVWMWDRVADAGVYFEIDAIGNVRRLRGGARYGAGAALPSDLGGYKYTAFGRSLSADAGTPAPVVDGVSFAQPLRWQGRWLDSATGLYDVRNRVWSPELAAFLSPDEFTYATTTGTLWSWPRQNPFAERDPTGRHPLLLPAIWGFLEGAGLGLAFSSVFFAESDEQAVINAMSAGAGAVGAGYALKALGMLAKPAANVCSSSAASGMPKNIGGLRTLVSDTRGALGDVGHAPVDARVVLDSATRWLGSGYREIAPGVYRSADGLRQFRMTASDLTPTHGNIGSHAHFESLDASGDVLENLHVPLTP